MTVTLEDLSDPGTYAAGVPHATFAWLRANDPVHWQPELEGRRGYWAITRYEDVVAISRDPETFSSGEGSAILEDLPEDALSMMRMQMVHMDPPGHTHLRKLISSGFTPRMIRELESHIRDLARTIVDRIEDRGECDFVKDVAAELPLQVIAEFLGVPFDDRWKLYDWTNRLAGTADPEFGSPEAAGTALQEMFEYSTRLAEEKRANPMSDLLSVLVSAQVDGARLSELELNMFFFLLMFAGNETTRNLISGGMQALCEFPEQCERLASDPALFESAVEEMLRWVTPVIQFRRTVTAEGVEIGGKPIKKGDKVVLYYASANRDESVFPHADSFDITRSPNPHVAFGFGPHFCLGANLARLEIRAMFEELLRRLPDLEVVGPIDRLRSNFINGTKSMPVRFKAR